MFNIKPNRHGLMQLFLISLGITILINGILFSLNINESFTQPVKPEYRLLPSSWVIGSLFTIAFAASITGRIKNITPFGSNLILMVTLWRLFGTFATSKLI